MQESTAKILNLKAIHNFPVPGDIRMVTAKILNLKAIHNSPARWSQREWTAKILNLKAIHNNVSDEKVIELHIKTKK